MEIRGQGGKKKWGKEGRANSLTSRACLRRISGPEDMTIYTSKLDSKEEKYKKQSRTPQTCGTAEFPPCNGSRRRVHLLTVHERNPTVPANIHACSFKKRKQKPHLRVV